jgi:hypothetical protein
MSITTERTDLDGRRVGSWLSRSERRSGGAGSGAAERLPVARRRRRPVPAAAGALLLLVCAYVGAQLALHGQPETELVTLVRRVPAGQALTAADLGTTRLSGGGVHGFAASSLQALVGRRTAVNLPAGTLLSNAVLTDAAVPAPGQQVLALALKPGAFPPGLQPGQAVGVLQVPAPNSTSLAPQVLAGRARVVSVDADSGSGVTVVSLALDNARVLDVAHAAAAGAVALSLLPTAG